MVAVIGVALAASGIRWHVAASMLLASAGTSMLCFALWASTELALEPSTEVLPRARQLTLRVVRAFAAAAGTVAAFAFVFTIMSRTLGTWIS